MWALSAYLTHKILIPAVGVEIIRIVSVQRCSRFNDSSAVGSVGVCVVVTRWPYPNMPAQRIKRFMRRDLSENILTVQQISWVEPLRITKIPQKEIELCKRQRKI